ncbi:hypothetical protein C8J56DRAFT_891178 [Mycena floridula]|nr:hypothetical protein C8J56DRAFT_891178 [Mycena floridula]
MTHTRHTGPNNTTGYESRVDALLRILLSIFSTVSAIRHRRALSSMSYTKNCPTPSVGASTSPIPPSSGNFKALLRHLSWIVHDLEATWNNMVLSIYLEFPVLPLYAWPRLQRPIWRSEDLVDEEQRFYGTMNYILRLATSFFRASADHPHFLRLDLNGGIAYDMHPVLQIVLSSYGQQLVKLDSTESLHSGRIFLGALFLSALLLFLIAFHHNFGLHTSCFPYWPVFHGIDSGCRREIQVLSWLNVASRVGVFLLAENSSLVNSGCHYKQIFASICVGGETGVTNGGLVSATGTVGLYPTGI